MRMMPKEEEQAIITMVKDFAEHELSPAVRKYDTQPESGFPSDLIRQVDELGLASITIPEECGGTGLDLSVAGLVIEELAAICPGFAIIVASSLVAASPLFLSEDMEKASRLYQTVMDRDGSCHTFALLAPDTGRPIKITAVPNGDGFQITGSCSFVLNGAESRLYTTFASVGGEIIACAIPDEAPGLHFSKPIQKLGLNIVPCCDVSLEDVAVPATHVLASSEKARAVLAGVEIQRHGLIGAAAVGCLRAELREATAYASERRQGGQAIVQHNAVSSLLADIAISSGAAGAVVHESLACSDEYKALLARIYATEMACTSAIDAVQVFGGYGFMRDLPVEKLMRDSQQMSLIGGSNGWLRICLQHGKV
jgi:alkylation response protein AidB-like acyl-CoA dehydrogenase